MIKHMTLLYALRRTHLLSVLISVCVAGLSLAVITFFALRTQVHENLELVARSIAYSTEAAVVFSDRDTAREIMERIAHSEQLLSVRIVLRGNEEFVRFDEHDANALDYLGKGFSRVVFPLPINAPITYEGKKIGEVILVGNNLVFIVFFIISVLTVAGCTVISLLVAFAIARSMERSINNELDAFTRWTRSVRLNQDFDLRMPSMNIVEFDELAQDVNALLDVINAGRAELEARQHRLTEANESLSNLAMHDPLTSLANRAYLNQKLPQVLQIAKTESLRFAVLFIDNDNFKRINDTYGHAAGDVLLIEVAKRIRKVLRDSDLVARLGGDEFAALLIPVREVADIEAVVEKIMHSLDVPVKLGEGIEVKASVSLGVAIYPDHGQNSDDLLRAADDAMYEAKNAGRGCYRIYHPEMTKLTHIVS